MKTSLYQPEQQNAMRYIEYGALYYHVCRVYRLFYGRILYVFYKNFGSISALFGKKIPVVCFIYLLCYHLLCIFILFIKRLWRQNQ